MWLPLKSGDSRPPLADSRIPSIAKNGVVDQGLANFDEHEITRYIKPGTHSAMYVDISKQ
jgi:hypothetical protein